MESKYSFVEKYEGNILVVGRTGCGKTTFIQNLRKKILFGNDILKFFGCRKFF